MLRMPPKLAYIQDIVPGRIDWKLKVRVIRLWSVPDYLNQELTNSIEMVVEDENGGRIHATIKRNLVSRFKEVVNEGLAHVIQNLLVAQADPKFRTTKHKYKLNFMGSTIVNDTVADKIPIITFRFVSFPEIINGGDESLLLDVIGHVVEKDNLKETEKNGKKNRLIEFVLEDLEKNKLNCTLWGEFADDLSAFLEKDTKSIPVVVILQLCKIKPYNGKMTISNAYHGTKLLINPNLKEDVVFREKLLNGEDTYSQLISQMSGHVSMSITDDLLQTDRMTIADLFESTEEVVGSVLAKILEIESEDDWWYEACSKCLRKAEPVGRKYYCEKCEKLVTAVPRFRIQVKVIDNSGSASFVMFDRLVSQLLGKSASQIIESSKKGYDEEEDVDTTRNVSVQVADNMKDFGSDVQEVTPSSKSPKKRAADELVVCSLSDDGATEMSSNKMLKNIKVE